MVGFAPRQPAGMGGIGGVLPAASKTPTADFSMSFTPPAASSIVVTGPAESERSTTPSSQEVVSAPMDKT